MNIEQAILAEEVTSEPIPRPADGDRTAKALSDSSSVNLAELLLKVPRHLDFLLRDDERVRTLVPRLLAVALAGFTIYGVVMTLVLNLSPFLPSWIPAARWTSGSVFNLILAYDIGLVIAIGVCLPSFYFYGLLAGVRISMLAATGHAIKGLAASAVAVVGLLPVYLAIALGTMIFELPAPIIEASLFAGLALPMIAGLWGARSLFVGFIALADTIKTDQPCQRACFLRRLIFSWCGCYTAVTPLAIYTLWQALSGPAL